MGNKSTYVQYGCAWSAPQGWRNFDASPTLRFEQLPLIGRLYVKNETRFPSNVEYGDITKGLPVDDATCDAVYCSHVLEHLSLNDCRAALLNTHKILKPGGVFRLVLPDLEYLVGLYVEKSRDGMASPAIEFMKASGLGLEKRDRGIKGLIYSALGNSQHFWMWDYQSLARELEAAGFVEIRRAQYGDSLIQQFKDVENKARWDNCLGIECKREQTSSESLTQQGISPYSLYDA